ncbi:MAG: hypothetical protein A2Z97_01795, partial [Bdellovibrionales bacterium GWB1_52_6]
GKKLKLALVLEQGACLHLNNAEVGIETGCLLEIKGGAVRIRSEKGEAFNFRGMTGSDFTVRIGDAWSLGVTKIEFLTLPDVPVEDEATRYVSFSQAMAGKTQPEQKKAPQAAVASAPASASSVGQELVVEQGPETETVELADAAPEKIKERHSSTDEGDLTGMILRMQVPEQPVAHKPVSRASRVNAADVHGEVPPEILRARKLREVGISLGMVFCGMECLSYLVSLGRERLIPPGVAGAVGVGLTWLAHEVVAVLARSGNFKVAALITLRHTAFACIALSAVSAGTLSLVMKFTGARLPTENTMVAAAITVAQTPNSEPSSAISAPQPIAAQAPAPAAAAAAVSAPVEPERAAAVPPAPDVPVIEDAFPDQKETAPNLEQASLSKDAFFSAIRSGDVSLVRSLVDKRIVDVNYTLDRGTPALHVASIQGHIPVIKYLLSKRANINARDSSGATALHWAVFKRQRGVAMGLVRHGSDLNAKTESGDRPIDIAKRYGLKNFISFLQPKVPVKKVKVQPKKAPPKKKKSSKNPF